MSSPLDEACAMLDDFEKEVVGIKAGWEQIAVDNPHFEQVSPENWQETYYRMWLHGATNIWERNELGRWLTDYSPSTTIANSPAKEICEAWRSWLNVAGPVKVEKVLDYDKKSRSFRERESKKPSEAFYVDHGRFEIQEPLMSFRFQLYIMYKGRPVGKLLPSHC